MTAQTNFRLAFLALMAACVVNAATVIAQVPNPFPVGDHVVWSQHEDAVYGLVFAPDGKWLASGSYDKSIKRWDTADGRVTATLQGHKDQVFRITRSPDGRSLYSCSGDGSAIHWNLTKGDAIGRVEGHGDPMMSVTYSPDGNLVATAGFHIQLWEQGQARWSTPHSQPFFAVAFSPDQTVLACGTENRVRFLRTDNGEALPEEIDVEGMVYQVEYSPNGKWLVVASGKQVAVWDVANQQLHKTAKADVSALFAATFSSDGEYLITGGRERVVRLWSVPELKPLTELYGPSETILSLAIAPDGQQIAAGAYDGTIHRWSRAH